MYKEIFLWHREKHGSTAFLLVAYVRLVRVTLRSGYRLWPLWRWLQRYWRRSSGIGERRQGGKKLGETRPNLVRKYRRWEELTQAELAEKVGVSRQTIANIERGNYSPSVHLALDICDVLKQSVEVIFGGKDAK